MAAKKPPPVKRPSSRLRSMGAAGHLRHVIDSAPIIITAVDADGIITVTAGHGITATGGTQGVHVGTSVFELCKDSPEVCAAIRRALKGEDFIAVVNHDGRWYESRYCPLRTADGQIEGCLSLATDVTELKQAEVALQQSREIAERTIEAVAGGIVFVNASGRIVRANPEAQRILGLSYDSMSRMFVADWKNATIREDGTALAVEDYPVSLCLRTGKKQGPIMIGVRRPDGIVSWGLYTAAPLHDAGNGVSGAVVTIYDVTDRRTLEERYKAFVRNSTEAIWCYEFDEKFDPTFSEDEKVEFILKHAYLVECNDAMAQMYGRTSSAEMIGARLSSLMVADDPRNIEAIRAYLRSNYALKDIESHERDAQGNSKYFLNNLFGILENGRLVRAWGTQRDITEIKKAEQALRDSERASRELIDATFDAIVIHDKGEILEINQGCTRLFGYPREEIIGRNVLDFAPRDAHDVIRRKMAVAADQPYEALGLRKDGSTFFVEAVGRPYNFKGRQVRVAALRDITPRKQAEAERLQAEHALERQRAEYETLFNSVSAMIWYKDTENRILRVNHAAATAMNMPVEQIEGRSTYDIYPQEARKYHEDDLEVIRSGKPKLGIVETLTTPTGVRRWMQTDKFPCFNDEGKVIGVVVMAVDITDRKRAEEAARESDERLRSIFNSVQDVMFLIDREHRYLSINEPVRHYGSQPSDIIGKTIFDLQPPDVAKVHAELHNQVFKTGKTIHVETKFRSGSKETDGERWHALTLSPVCDAHGNVTAVSGISRDITDLKNAERERVALERKLLEAQKLESMGVLAGGIAHDFNNLLAAILGNVSLASMQVPPDSPLRTNLQSIETTTHRAAELCKQMLAFAGKSRIDVQRVDVNAIISEMLELLKISIGRTTLLKFNFAKNLPQITADATQLRQVVMNLILNASEAIVEKEGAIGLNTSIVDLTRSDLIDTFSAPDCAPGKYLSIEISDTGCGMDEQTRLRIFDPFFTTKFSGRGLGLAAVMGIVRGHHGAIRVQSTPGQGTVFTVLLPVAAPKKSE